VKITVAALETARGSLSHPASNARARWTERAGVLLVLAGEDGHRGQGEASPLPGLSPDTADAAFRALAALAGRAFPWELDLCLPIVPQVVAFLRAHAPSEPSAHFALETALLDLAGQRLGLPVSTLLAGRWPTRPVPLAALLDGETPEALEAGARAARLGGFPAVKVKVARPWRFDAELEALERVRTELGAHVALRLDANGAWSRAEAPVRLAALARFLPEFVEQPVPADQLPGWRDAPVPLAADETLALEDGLDRLRAEGGAQVAVLKPTVLGGLLRCRTLAADARAAGMQVVVSHALEGPVALAAAAELALSLEPPPLACGLAPHAGLAAWPATAIKQLAGPAIVPAPVRGLGLAPLAGGP
jgi:o-succinylbenzoate synthase